MEYKILAKDFERKGFTYHQLFRAKEFAIYKQSRTNWGPKCGWFIAIKIGRHDGFQIGGVDIPPSETFPGDEKFGVEAFACPTLEKAKEYINLMKNHSDQIIAHNKEADPETGQIIRRGSTVLKCPDVEFCVKDLIPLNKNVKFHNFYPMLHKLITQGKIRETHRGAASRGKAIIYYQKT